ncbi:hypothetical protein GCM10009102_22310 [Sphingomonas insulae]|uniref:Uncharacterized protein n=1 Tax=Sphingomonas insulae TaxID=424800 RepID=A0ABN1HWL9_9SPHN
MYPRIMAVTVTPETLRRLIREAEAERGRVQAPTLKRAFAQLAAGYSVQLQRITGAQLPESPGIADWPRLPGERPIGSVAIRSVPPPSRSPTPIESCSRPASR